MAGDSVGVGRAHGKAILLGEHTVVALPLPAPTATASVRRRGDVGADCGLGLHGLCDTAVLASVAAAPIWFEDGVAHPLTVGLEAAVVLADTGDPSSTREAVTRVRSRLAGSPAHAERLLTRATALVRAAAEDLSAGRVAALGRRLLSFHTLLASVGVSTAGIEALIEVALDAGALGAKLTGGGLGGCVLALSGTCQGAEAAAARRGPAHLDPRPGRRRPMRAEQERVGAEALAVASAAAYGLDLDARALSRPARRGSGSACRSLFGGFVQWYTGTGDGPPGEGISRGEEPCGDEVPEPQRPSRYARGTIRVFAAAVDCGLYAGAVTAVRLVARGHGLLPTAAVVAGLIAATLYLRPLLLTPWQSGRTWPSATGLLTQETLIRREIAWADVEAIEVLHTRRGRLAYARLHQGARITLAAPRDQWPHRDPRFDAEIDAIMRWWRASRS